MRRSLCQLRFLHQYLKPSLAHQVRGFSYNRLVPKLRLEPRLACHAVFRYNHGMVPVSTRENDSDNRLSDEKIESTTYTEEKVVVEGSDVPAPFLSFDDYQWPAPIASYIKSKKFSHPTPIQAQAMPIALEGRDLVGIAHTGSGKTLAFLLPAIVHIMEKEKANPNGRYNGPDVLIMAPTRELAQQIVAVCEDLRHYPAVCLYGGASRLNQHNLLDRVRPKIVIGTPGRINDFLDSRWLNLENVSYLVLDEADRMLDLGFEPQIRRIIDQTNSKRQTLMWSATWPEEVRNLAQDFLNDYIQINVGSKDLRANPNITQNVVFCEPYEKTDKFLELVSDLVQETRQSNGPQTNKILIFTQTKKQVDYLTRLLNSKRLFAMGIHGDKSQTARDGILRGFREGARQILIATDVASRGLDVDDIKYVINYDMPQIIEDYVHRIGRTGRQGKSGTSYTFFTVEDSLLAKDLVDMLEHAGAEVDEKLVRLAQSTKRDLKRARSAWVRDPNASPRDSYSGNQNRNDRPRSAYSGFRRY